MNLHGSDPQLKVINLDDLPQEVFDRIVGYLPINDEHALPLHRLANLSHEFNKAVERRTFQSLRIRSFSDLRKFRNLFSSSWTYRRSYLRKLEFHIFLPLYSNTDSAVFETDDDGMANTKDAILHLQYLFRVLSPWSAGNTLELIIDIYSPTDFTHQREERTRYFYLHLPYASYPPLPCVTSFILPGDVNTRYLEPSSIFPLTAAFPNLNAISWRHRDPGYFLPFRCQHIKQFTEAIRSLSTCPISEKLRRLMVTIESDEYPHNERLPNLTGMIGEPSLCDVIRTLIDKSKLRVVNYEGPVSPSLFWPDDGSEAPNTSGWETVVKLDVRFTMASPSGDWYFQGHPVHRYLEQGTDVPLPLDTVGVFPPGHVSRENTTAAVALLRKMDPEYWNFRCIPKDQTMMPLLMAFARCLSRMPSLVNAIFDCELGFEAHTDAVATAEENSDGNGDDGSDDGSRGDEFEDDGLKGDWFIVYGAPGFMCGFENMMEVPDLAFLRPRFFINTDSWKPGEEVDSKFRAVGRAIHGVDAVVTYLPPMFDAHIR